MLGQVKHLSSFQGFVCLPPGHPEPSENRASQTWVVSGTLCKRVLHTGWERGARDPRVQEVSGRWPRVRCGFDCWLMLRVFLCLEGKVWLVPPGGQDLSVGVSGKGDTHFSALLVTHLSSAQREGTKSPRLVTRSQQVAGFLYQAHSWRWVGPREREVRCFREEEPLLGPDCQWGWCRMRERLLPTHLPGPLALSPRGKRGGRKR